MLEHCEQEIFNSKLGVFQKCQLVEKEGSFRSNHETICSPNPRLLARTTGLRLYDPADGQICHLACKFFQLALAEVPRRKRAGSLSLSLSLSLGRGGAGRGGGGAGWGGGGGAGWGGNKSTRGVL